MPFIVIALVMSIAAVCGLFALRALLHSRAFHHFFFSGAAGPTFAHSGPAGYAPGAGLRPDGWALIDRALRARNAVKFDVR
jgi:hypothetical protein